MSTSASRASSSRSSCPRGSRRLSVMHFLLRTRIGHSRLLPSTCPRPHSRIESGLPGGSTLMTSAPRSPRRRPAKGPASIPPSSMTRRPSSGPGPPSGTGLLERPGETLAGAQDVLLHELGRGVGVAGRQSVDHALVPVARRLLLVGGEPHVRPVDERQVDDR